MHVKGYIEMIVNRLITTLIVFDNIVIVASKC